MQSDAYVSFQQLFNEVIDAIAVHPNIHDLAEEAGVSPGTLYRWLRGGTVWPHTRTLFNVAWSLGFTVTWKRTRQLRRVA